MPNQIHFISGLPRAGSTLLAAILRQNPAFSAAMTSPVGSLYMALETAMSRRNEASVMLDARQRQALLRGLFSGLYEALDPSTVVFDTNRLWSARLPALAGLFPQARVICCVRPVSWIIDSIERQANRNPYELSGLFGYEAGGTVYTRATRVAASDGIVGYALDALREACFGDYSDRLILLDYETLAREPEAVIEQLYAMLDEPLFDHDFDHVGYEAAAFDNGIGSPGLHTVRERVEWQPRTSILPPDLFDRYVNDAFWLRPHPRLALVPMIPCREPDAGRTAGSAPPPTPQG
jgi:sulfotransferase